MFLKMVLLNGVIKIYIQLKLYEKYLPLQFVSQHFRNAPSKNKTPNARRKKSSIGKKGCRAKIVAVVNFPPTTPYMLSNALIPSP